MRASCASGYWSGHTAPDRRPGVYPVAVPVCSACYVLSCGIDPDNENPAAFLAQVAEITSDALQHLCCHLCQRLIVQAVRYCSHSPSLPEISSPTLDSVSFVGQRRRALAQMPVP